MGGLPIGLAHHLKLRNDVAVNQAVRFSDVDIDESLDAFIFRRQMEQTFG